MKNFDPSAPGVITNNIYGLPFGLKEASVVIIPVPWEVTVSYRTGAAQGPKAVFDASFQVDLHDPLVPDAWKIGITMDEISPSWEKSSNSLRDEVEHYLDMLVKKDDYQNNPKALLILKKVNKECAELKDWLKNKCLDYINNGKLVAVLGGDHSTPLGFIEAIAQKHPAFGILHIDAHFDLRKAYEGFQYSHASVMYNALELKQLKKLVSVGIRDYCEEEISVVNKKKERIVPFYFHELEHKRYKGQSWDEQCNSIVDALPKKVYLSFDIDGLDPRLCPHTGTPVPGGLEYDEAIYLINKVVESGRKIVGLDLNEVAPNLKNTKDDWDGNVGARLLYRLCNLMAKSNHVLLITIIGDVLLKSINLLP